MSNDQMKISGKYKVADWKKLKTEIDNNPDVSKLWEKAYDIFLDRVNTRHLAPINQILQMDLKKGERFSAVSLHCALIEFLAAIHDGAIYKYNKPDKLKYEYSNSCELFVKFLSSVEPFKAAFECKERDFYSNIRCGLLHEAATKGNWKIKASPQSKVINTTPNETILDPDQLHKLINGYITNDYKKMLIQDPKIQEAFVRKMDSICNP